MAPHIGIVSRLDVERAKNVKKAARQQTRWVVGISDDSGSSSESEDSMNMTGSTGTGANTLRT